MSYEPRGKMIDLVAAMRARPTHIFTAPEVAAILCCKNFPSTIDQYLYAASASGLVFRRKIDGAQYYAGTQISDAMLTENGIAIPAGAGTGPRILPSPNYTAAEVEAARADVRAPKVVPGWTPPKMIATRGAREPVRAPLPEPMHRIIAPAPALDLGKPTTSAATASGHEIPDSASTLEPVEAAGPGQERHKNADQHPAGAGERCDEVANEGEAMVPSRGGAPDEEEKPVEFNAAFWLDGDVVVYGAQANDDGSFTLTREQVDTLANFLDGAKIARAIATIGRGSKA